jgi:hypothetical protein
MPAAAGPLISTTRRFPDRPRYAPYLQTWFYATLCMFSCRDNEHTDQSKTSFATAPTAYSLPCVEVIFKLVKQMQAWGDERIKKIVAALSVEGIKICIAADIATDIWYLYSYVCAYFLQYTF